MLLRTVDKHLICTVFTAPIILDIVIFTKSTMQKSHLCKKKLLTIITHILLRNCYEIWFRDLYLQFFLRNIYYSSAFFRRV